VRRAVLRLAGALAVTTAVVGVAHAPPFRAALRRASCPVGGDATATATQREATRLKNLAPRAGTGDSPTRLVWGLSLGAVSDAGARAALGLDEARCTKDRSGLVSECRLGPTTTFLRSNDLGQVVAVATVTRTQTLAEALVASQERLGSLEASFGPAHHQRGRFDEAHLAQGTLAQARADWAYSDVVLSVSATNLGDGVVVTTEAQVLSQERLSRR
jgi:hypothetical protein